MYLPKRTEHQKIDRLYDRNEVGQGFDLNKKFKPPVVYILNHEKFRKSPDKNRVGSSKDVEALCNTFNNLNCRVKVISNPELSDVKKKLKEWSEKQFTQEAGFVLCILSHGFLKETILACDDKEYNLDDDVLFPLFRNPTLSGKPKILIVQACKGKFRADAKKMNNEPYIKCYSTSEGYVSYRNEAKGSIFIQTLCEIMDQYGHKKDFQTIFKYVKAEVQRRSIQKGAKQIPSDESQNFDAPFYFGNYVQNA
ncbi:caspase-3 isoform X1 [Drosophila yakuba]|uniref:Damm, isoform A n=1 Tax=Drosophila yakuba TaxID=7245 RepID=B4P5Z9_DROYA|nr:caspase-3 isoform X1 [Drosophila yakuba]EDW90874.1 damm, isoform A [Drosophila yakuba]